MTKLRKGCSYRRLERPYTRKSKYKKLSYIRAFPVSKIVRYDMGDLKKQFPVKVELVVTKSLQLRHNCLEAARISCNRWFEKMCGKNGFHLKLNVFPHHVLRENPLASGAGADRMSTGMAGAFGKPIGIAAQVIKGQVVFYANIEKEHIGVARQALRRAATKLPCTCRIVVRQ